MTAANFLITGCYRSGTTLADKLLHTHPGIVAASQAYPLLYSMAKQRFLEQRGIERRYPLDHLFLESAYTASDFRAFLDSHHFNADDIRGMFDGLEGFVEDSWTPELLRYRDAIQPSTLLDILTQLNACLLELFPKQDAVLAGSKEIMVEEFIPWLLDTGGYVTLVTRDPRDVVLSAHYSKKSFLGDYRPILYTLRAWRRSAAYALAYKTHPRFVRLEFGSLVRDPRSAVDTAAMRFGLKPLDGDPFLDGVIDQQGRPWKSNSSFGETQAIDAKATGKFRDRLPEDVIRFVEAACFPEMRALGYPFACSNAYDPDALFRFREPFEVTHERFRDDPDYSTDPARLTREQERIEHLARNTPMADHDIEAWFLHPQTHEHLSAAMRPDDTSMNGDDEA